MDEQTMRVLSAERTKLKATWYTLGGISVVIDGKRCYPDAGYTEDLHLDAPGQSLGTAREALKEAILQIEASLTWLRPTEDDE